MFKSIIVLFICFNTFAKSDVVLPLKELVDSMKEISLIINNVNDEDELLLADQEGFALYTFSVDQDGVSNCFDECLRTWPAFITESEELPKPFGIHVREDGVKQVTLNDRPLYYFKFDQNPGDIRGHLLGGVWFKVIIPN